LNSFWSVFSWLTFTSINNWSRRSEWFALTGAVASFIGIWLCPEAYLAPVVGLFFYCCFQEPPDPPSAEQPLDNDHWRHVLLNLLIHWMLITTFGGRFSRQFSNSFAVDYIIHAFLPRLADPACRRRLFYTDRTSVHGRDWHKRVFARVKSAFTPRKVIPQGPLGTKNDLDGFSLRCLRGKFPC